MSQNLAVEATTRLNTILCGECGGVYAISEKYRQTKQQDGGYWSCPYCKCTWGYGESEIDRLKKEMESEKKRTEWAKQDAKNQRERAETAEAKERGQRAAKTRIKNRVANGVCPCCKRTFQNLLGHMKNQHPHYSKND